MHGLGNDFVVVDLRKQKINIDENIKKKLSDRRAGAGCDQIITIEDSLSKGVDGKIKIFNANGDQAEACGNGTRCVASIFFKELNKKKIILESVAGKLRASLKKDGNVSVNMGSVKENWIDIPLFQKMDNTDIPIKIKNFSKGFALNIGNPHIVFFGKNIKNLDLKYIGPKIENHIFFPKKINVEFIEIINNKLIKMRVWERGAGETLACGSGASAAVYAGFKKKLLNNKCEVALKKGSLFIDIVNEEVIMTGPTEISYYGNILI